MCCEVRFYAIRPLTRAIILTLEASLVSQNTKAACPYHQGLMLAIGRARQEHDLPERLTPEQQPVRPSRSKIPFVQLERCGSSSTKLQDALVSCSAGSWSSLEQRSFTDHEVRSRPDVISCAK